MDLQYNNPSEHGRNEQIISQFLLKSLHIVLESRVPSIRPSGRRSLVKKSDKWFNLALGERPTALDSLNFWHRNLMEPMIIDIILVQETPAAGTSLGSGSGSSGYGTLVETVIERWVVQYEYSRSSHHPQVGTNSESYKKTYKKSIILLRSLYTMMRLLPAYRAYRKLCISNSKGCGFDINYKVSSFSAPFTRTEEESMNQYSFFPVEAQHGRLSISVKYRESLSDFNLETSASFPPEIIITDYVGSPATDPFRAFPKQATSFPVREMQFQSPTAPPQRPHSWTNGLTRGPQGHGSPPAHRSSSGRYDLSSSPTDVAYNGPNGPNYNYRPLTTSHHSFDDYQYQLSPPFTPSPSPSPPTYSHSRLRLETAPVSIPTSPRYMSPNLHLPPPSPRSTRYDESPSGVRSFKKSEMSRVSRDNKDDSGRFSGLLSSSGSPRVGFSRSSSRVSMSLRDELDDIDFSCPFIVDDVDTCDSPVSESSGSVGGKQGIKKSQDAAAVGALVRMLRTAPPLRQDSSCYSNSNSNSNLLPEFNNNVSASGLFMARSTSDAIEELKAYTDIKQLILSKSFLTKEQGL